MAVATGYIVICGSYSDLQNLRVFTDRTRAEQWARDYNADVPWSHADDKARVEEIDLDS
jgi:hypothetical protein